MIMRPTPVTSVLLATSEAQAAYRGVLISREQLSVSVNFFSQTVDVVRATEEAGGDPIPVIRDILLAWQKHTDGLFRTAVGIVNETVRPIFLVTPP